MEQHLSPETLSDEGQDHGAAAYQRRKVEEEESLARFAALDNESDLADVKHIIGTCNDQHAVMVQGEFKRMNETYAVIKSGSSIGIANLSSNPPSIHTESAFHLLKRNDWKLVDTLTRNKDTVPKEVSLSQAWLKWKRRRTYDGGLVFAPGQAVRADQYNLFQGFAIEPIEGDWSLLQSHLRDIVCAGNEKYYNWLMSWLADIVQKPGHKPGSCVVLRGEQGVGKSTVFDYFRKLIGDQYCVVVDDTNSLTGRFNSHFMSALFVQAEEAVWAGDRAAAGKFKNLITQQTLQIEQKGLDSFPIQNYSRIAMTTNENWAVPATGDSRRFFVLDVLPDHMQDSRYFGAINVQMLNLGGLEAWMYDLMHWQTPEDVDLRNPPHTDALADQILESLAPQERFWVEAVMTGEMFEEDRESWISSRELLDKYNDYCDEHKQPYSKGANRMGHMQKRLWGFETDMKRDPMQGNKVVRWYILPSLERARKAVSENSGIPIHKLA